ncbi:MAG: hypothetical protein GX162_08705 [Firmicutes bacterium]|nr:hypothetical protein [Bacillota bacterium]
MRHHVLMHRSPRSQIRDTRYPQKHAASVTLPGGRPANDVRALAYDHMHSRVLCGTAWGLFAVRQQFVPPRSLAELPPEWAPVAEIKRLDEGLPSPDVKEVRTGSDGIVWAATLEGVASLVRDEWQAVWKDTLDQGYGAVLSVWADQTGFWAVTSHGGLGRVEKGQWRALDWPSSLGRPLRIDSAGDGLWVCATKGVLRLRFGQEETIPIVMGHQVRRVVQQGDNIYFGTSRGLFRVGSDDVAERVTRPVPVIDIHDLLAVSDEEMWAATSRGVWRTTPGERAMHYYHGMRYIPHPFCRALLRTPEGSVWVATAAGLAHLAELPHTLEEKAARFEYRVRKRHQRLDGYVTSSRLSKAGDLSTNVPRPSDNDGLWTSMYLGAQCFRFAVTKEEPARTFAQQAFAALERLEAVTTIPGFPTKAIIRPDDPHQHQTRVPWLPSADGQWLWKADCSSDEIVGHFFGYALYYDLVAGPQERDRVAELVTRIMDHIIDNGYYLIGPDGKPTQWGVWAPEMLNGPWKSQQGLNSLEILSHLRAAYHITGNDRYLGAYHELIERHHYAENTRRQKIDVPGHVNHSDDELAFLSYYPLLTYEDDPELRAIYLDSLEHNWQIERPERNPLWNIIYGVLTGNECDLDAAVRTLREIPMDLIDWDVDNSARLDLELDAESGRFGELQSVEVLPYDELPIAKWNSNPYRVVGGGGGYGEDDGTYYLLPYWMARYHGLII